jgi:hypothetical protein
LYHNHWHGTLDKRFAGLPSTHGASSVPKRKRGNTLERWEISIIKAMLERGGYNDQDILAYFTRPTRSVNHRVIGKIRTETKHKTAKAAGPEELDEFLSIWPDVDPQTGLSLRGDELLIKARDAMIAAVHTFNGAGLNFRAELFIVTCIIAWTYLMHAGFRREGVDYRYKEGGVVKKTKHGAELYWALGKCLRHAKCPIPLGAVHNLDFLLDLRHEIEHRSTTRIDDAVSAKLQACCINFNEAIKALFGLQFGLEKRLPIALQFVTFDARQRSLLKKASALPANIETMMDAFHGGLSEEEQADQAFAYRIVFVPKLGNRASNSDLAVEFIKSDTDEAREINRVLLKEVDKRRYTAGQVIRIMKDEGYKGFNQARHTELWRELSAKNPAKGFGREGDYNGTWIWYDSWLERVRFHCQEHAGKYKS